MNIPEPDWWQKWTYYDEENMRTELRDDAPDWVRKEWEEQEERWQIPDIEEAEEEQ